MAGHCFRFWAGTGKPMDAWAAPITPDQQPKYKNSPGLKNAMEHGARKASTAVIVEGIMDALRVDTALLQVQGTAAIARLGSSITALQLDQLREYERLVIFPDFDRAGVHGATELAERISEDRDSQLSIVIPAGMTGSDPGSMQDPGDSGLSDRSCEVEFVCGPSDASCSQ